LCWTGIDPIFANNSWETIAVACQNNAVPDSWSVGDQKTMTIEGVDYAVDIIGKNHDNYSDGSAKAPLTFQLHDCYKTKYSMNNSNTNLGRWNGSLMCTTHIANIFSLLPTVVKNAIREVNKITSKGTTQSSLVSSKDKLFLLSEKEVTGLVKNSFSGEGTQYSYYANGGSSIKRIGENPVRWWTRSPTTGTGSFAVIETNGSGSSNGASLANGVSFAFCF
jgi:hypothetical protein